MARRPSSDIAWLKKVQAEHEPLNLLVDFGNVVVKRLLRKKDGSLYEVPRSEYHLCRPVPRAIEHLSWLVEALGPKHVYMCKGLPNDYTQETKSLIISQLWRWVDANHFLERTKIDPNRILFKTRLGKVSVCMQKGGNWIVLDDRAEILAAILPMQEMYGERLQFIAVNPNHDEWKKYIPTEEWLEYGLLREAPTFAETPKEWWEAIIRLRRKQIETSKVSKGEFY